MGVGESTSERAYILEVLGEASRVVQEIPVSGHMRIGRLSAEFKPDVSIPDECTSASRQHAVLDLRGERPVLEDQSRYGTRPIVAHSVGGQNTPAWPLINLWGASVPLDTCSRTASQAVH